MLCVGQSLCAGSLPFLPGPTSLGEPGLFCPLVIRAVPGSSWAHRCPSPHLPAAPVRSRPPTVAEPIVAGNVFAYCTAICSLYHPGFRFSDTNYHCSTDFSGLLFVCMPAARLSTARTSVLKAYLTPVCVCVCVCVCCCLFACQQLVFQLLEPLFSKPILLPFVCVCVCVCV